jgi:hypothetical protein
MEKRKFFTLPGLDSVPLFIQLLASRYTDCAIPAPIFPRAVLNFCHRRRETWVDQGKDGLVSFDSQATDLYREYYDNDDDVMGSSLLIALHLKCSITVFWLQGNRRHNLNIRRRDASSTYRVLEVWDATWGQSAGTRE